MIRLLFIVALVLVALAVYFTVRAIQARSQNKWRSDFKTLTDGETEVYIAKGNEQITYASIAPLENYKAGGKSAFDRQAEIDIALEDAELWAKKHAK